MHQNTITSRRGMVATLATLPWLGSAWAQTMQHAMGGTKSMAAPTWELAPLNTVAAGKPLASLITLKNTSTQPGLFRATLRAAPVSVAVMKDGTQTEFWAYNNNLPGPLIEVMEGDTVEIEFINDLPQESTIHWHGLPVPPEQDGNPQDAVAPGARRLYRFKLPLDSAGSPMGTRRSRSIAAWPGYSSCGPRTIR